MRSRLLLFVLAIICTLSTATSYAQHTFGVYGGWGSGSMRPYPIIESKSAGGLMNAGFSWRTYSEQPYVGCFGIDIELMQRGYKVSPFASSLLEDEPITYFTREINSLVVPIVWQPHVYLAHRRVRAFIEAAATFSFDLSSTYDNDIARQEGTEGKLSGDYDYLLARDNRVGYGLMGGGGVAILIERFEVLFKARYIYGLSDVMRNRNKYYENTMGDLDNPFGLTPLRSPIDNINFSFGLNYRLSADGFKSWEHKKVKRTKSGHKFDYQGE